MKQLMYLFLAVGFIGLVTSCKNKETQAGDAAAVATADTMAVTYTVDTAATTLAWVGSKPAGKHNGTIDIKEGNLSVQNGEIKAGSFTIDMNTITVLDLTGKEKMGLEGHLKGLDPKSADDFFNAAKYPTGKFEITKVAGLENDSTANKLVYGNLTLRDISKEVSFKAKVDVTDAGVTVMTAPFDVNRTDYGIKYGSKTFFDNLKDKFIDDVFTVQVNLTAKK